MKKAVLYSVLLALCIMTLAQVPESFNYQVVVRDGTSNNPLTNQNVSFQMSILKGSSSGESQYSELHSANTGDLGLVNLVIGNGTGKTGDITTIDWGADTYYLKVEIDKSGGSSFIEIGTTQLWSVPYALFSKTAESMDFNELINKPNGVDFGDMLYWNGTSWIVVPVGLKGQFLKLSSSLIPTWSGPTYPSVTTTPANVISSNSVTGGGVVTNDGGGSITSRGVCWSTSENPTIDDSKTNDGAGSGGFSSSVTGLNPNTIYYIKAYAINSAGLNYGDQMSFTTLETMSDITGYVYNTISIGTQIWMKENLQTNKYNDETTIPYSSISGFGGVSGPAFYYINSTYGSLYNGYAVATNKLCPTGWHTPSDEEWKTLEISLGMTQIEADLFSQWRGTDQGRQLKCVSFNGTNTSGFTALGGGWINENGVGISVGLNETGKWWTGTVAGSGANFIREMQKNINSINRTGGLYGCGSSIRCIKD